MKRVTCALVKRTSLSISSLQFGYTYMYFTDIGYSSLFFFFQAEDGIRDRNVTGVQTCALPICYCFKTKKKYYEAEALYDEFKKRYAANLNEYLSQLDRVKYTADVNSALLNAETDQEFLDRLMLEPFYQLDVIKEILLGSDEQLRDQILSVFSVSYEKEVKELKKIIASEKEAEKLVDKNQRRRQTNAAKSKLERK